MRRDFQSFLRIAAVASAGAAVCLIVLAFLPRPPFAYSHGRIVAGSQVLTSEQAEQYTAYLRANLSFDAVYLLGHVLTWLGYAALVARRQRVVAGALAAVGLASGGLDLLENEVRWAVAGSLGTASAAGPAVGLVWETVVGMSFWAIYVAALATSAAIFSMGRLGRLTAAVGFLCVPAAAVVYARGFFFSFLWLIAWHAVSAAFLWRADARE